MGLDFAWMDKLTADSASEALQASILKGIKAGEDPTALLFQLNALLQKEEPRKRMGKLRERR